MTFEIGLLLGFLYGFFGLLAYSGDLAKSMPLRRFIAIFTSFILWPLFSLFMFINGVDPDDIEQQDED